MLLKLLALGLQCAQKLELLHDKFSIDLNVYAQKEQDKTADFQWDKIADF